MAESVIYKHLQQGKLVDVLADWQTPSSVPVTLLYPHQNLMPSSMRAFSDWVAGIFKQGDLGKINLSL